MTSPAAGVVSHDLGAARFRSAKPADSGGDCSPTRPRSVPTTRLQWRVIPLCAEVDSELRYVELSEDGIHRGASCQPGKGILARHRSDTGRIDAAPIAGTSTPTDGLVPARPHPLRLGADRQPITYSRSTGIPILVEVRSDTHHDGQCGIERVTSSPRSPGASIRGMRSTSGSWSPFDGYWVRNPSDTTVCLLDPSARGAGRNRLARGPARDCWIERPMAWAIAITAAAAGAVDDANLAGVSPDAAHTTWDACRPVRAAP